MLIHSCSYRNTGAVAGAERVEERDLIYQQKLSLGDHQHLKVRERTDQVKEWPGNYTITRAKA